MQEIVNLKCCRRNQPRYRR